jgi:hypothetical protein
MKILHLLYYASSPLHVAHHPFIDVSFLFSEDQIAIMVSLMMSPVTLSRRGYDEIPTHPLERLQPLRIDTALRRSTFSDWPINAPVSPNILCDNGFYYMGMHDKVQCAFCGGVLSGWAKDDDVQHEHARHFGRCELVRIKQRQCFEFSRPVSKSEEQYSNSNIKPYNAEYSLYSDRLSSFQSWPRHMQQTPEDLSTTGLYYKGTYMYIHNGSEIGLFAYSVIFPSM